MPPRHAPVMDMLEIPVGRGEPVIRRRTKVLLHLIDLASGRVLVCGRFGHGRRPYGHGIDTLDAHGGAGAVPACLHPNELGEEPGELMMSPASGPA